MDIRVDADPGVLADVKRSVSPSVSDEIARHHRPVNLKIRQPFTAPYLYSQRDPGYLSAVSCALDR